MNPAVALERILEQAAQEMEQFLELDLLLHWPAARSGCRQLAGAPPARNERSLRDRARGIDAEVPEG